MLNRKITENIRDFILRFGQDFMFIAPNYRLRAGDDEKFVDLLFFNRQLNCLVAVELKDCRFKPIGLVLCREMDRTVVELAIQDYTKPMGVATFRLGEDAPEEYNNILPDTVGLNEIMQEEDEADCKKGH